MSKWKQYLFLGGGLFLFQSDFIKRIFQSESFLYTVLGAIVFLLITAVIITVPVEKRRKKQRDDDLSL